MARFQALPWDVAYAVVRHVLDEPPAGPDGAKYAARTGRALSGLLDTSRLWRSAALAFVCHTYMVSFAARPRTVITSYRGWPRGRREPGSYAARHIRCISIVAGLASVASGESAAALRDSGLDRAQFGSVCALDVSVSCAGVLSEEQVPDAERNVARFGDALLGLLPALGSVSITLRSAARGGAGVADDASCQGRARMGRLAGSLASRLCARVARAQLSVHVGMTPVAFGAAPVANLASLCVSMGEKCDGAGRLLQLNAHCLQSLTVRFATQDAVYAMVHSSTGPVCYPRLKRLEMGPEQHIVQLGALPSTAGCPFPVLAHLKLEMAYPFSDDTLFRGCALESLQALPGDPTVRMLSQHIPVMGARRHGLRRLALVLPSEYARWSGGADMSMVSEVVNSCLPRLQQLAVAVRASPPGAVEVVDWACAFPSSLCVLEIRVRDLTTGEIVAVLGGLPRLRTLVCSHYDDGDDPLRDGVDALHAEHYPLSASLRRWVPYQNRWRSNRQYVSCTMALAVLCPGLVRVEIPAGCDDRARFNRLVRWRMQSDRYRRHASSIARILFPEPPAETAADGLLDGLGGLFA